MKVLIVCIYPPGIAPGQRYRFEQYIAYLEENGIEITFSNALNAADYKLYYSKGKLFQKGLMLIKAAWKRWKETLEASKYDVVFVYREAFMIGGAFFEKRFAKKSKVIFDFDDAIWINIISSGNKIFRFLKSPEKTKEIINLSSLVFAGNTYLANYARQFNNNVVILPSTINTEEYKPDYKTGKSKVCIGWTGSFSTSKNLYLCMEALRKIKNKYGDKVYFKVIGDPNFEIKELGIKGIHWSAVTEAEDLKEIDIGIMPLANDDWAKGKCGMKGLQYMGMAIPTIMSPVGANAEIIQDGKNGFLASAQDEWVDKLSQLIDSEELRTSLGANGRKTVEEKYSIEANKDFYLAQIKSVGNK